eukprot:1432199-Rhodomonas_salina.1
MLTLARVSTTAIDRAFCGNVISCLGNFGDCQSPKATGWVARADDLLQRNLLNNFCWHELFNDLSTTLAADLR